MKARWLVILLTVFLVSCSENKPPIKILSNSWIGFTPLFYAQEKGWLDEANIKLSTVVSLGESSMIFSNGEFDGLTGTQFEYHQLSNKQFDIVPVVMFDRSNGGDMIMANLSLEEISKVDGEVNVVLEVNSINMPVFQDFVRHHNLENVKFNFINKDQAKLVSFIKSQELPAPTLAVTYIPYNFELQSIGFKTIASSRDIDDLLILDALFVKRESLEQNRQAYQQIAEAVKKSLHDLHENPKMYYEVVKHYLESPSYEDFKSSLSDIQWLAPPFDQKLQERMQQINFPYQDII